MFFPYNASQPRDQGDFGDRHNHHVHLGQIAEWERKIIGKIREQSNESHRSLISTSTAIDNRHSEPRKKRSNIGSLSTISAERNIGNSLSIDAYHLVSDWKLDNVICRTDQYLSLLSSDESNDVRGRVSFTNQRVYTTGVHHIRLYIEQFSWPSSWAFVGIVRDLKASLSNNHKGQTSFGWHLGRQSILWNRQLSTKHSYDGRDTRQGDILQIIIDCNRNTIRLTNERTQNTHLIYVNSACCSRPWVFAINFNYNGSMKDRLRLVR